MHHRRTHSNIFITSTHRHKSKQRDTLTHTHTELSEHSVKSEGLLMEADSLAAVSSKCRGNADLCPAGCNWISFLLSAEFKKRRKRNTHKTKTHASSRDWTAFTTKQWLCNGRPQEIFTHCIALVLLPKHVTWQTALSHCQLCDNL